MCKGYLFCCQERVLRQWSVIRPILRIQRTRPIYSHEEMHISALLKSYTAQRVVTRREENLGPSWNLSLRC